MNFKKSRSRYIILVDKERTFKKKLSRRDLVQHHPYTIDAASRIKNNKK